MFIGDSHPLCNLCHYLTCEDIKEVECEKEIPTKMLQQSMLLFIVREDLENCPLFKEILEEKERKKRVNFFIEKKEKKKRKER